MELLSVDYRNLLSCSKELREKCLMVERNISKVCDITQELDIFWDGDANAQFVTVINENLIFMESVIINIRTVISDLIRIIEEYQDTEKVVSQIVGGIRI